jgi:hypothetical protein
MSFFKNILVFLFVLFMIPAFAEAQDAPAAPPVLAPPTAVVPSSPYKDVPDEYLQEAEKVYQNCSASSKLNFYYNCECMGVSYLDKRIAAGPMQTPSAIMLSLSRECQDATNAAGYQYTQCLQSANLAPDKPDSMSLEKYCTCVANTYAKLFETLKMQPNSKTFTELQTRASLMCSNPALARKMYPNF